jgi:HD-like signal output (HDOD) protein/CheY-like chemotaxis protein
MDKKRLLFVDDDPMILKGLQRSLRKMQGEWEVSYADSGEAALAGLVARPVDVVVSDMRMPGMDGVALLSAVKERYPQIVRIILSGQLDRDMTLKSVTVAHQLLAKPCDVAVLRKTLHKTLALNQVLADDAIRRVVARIDTLPSMPASCIAIMAELQSEEASIQQVADLIAGDLGMAAKILQMVNSAFFGLYRRVNDVKDAVMLLGLDAIKALVLSINVFSAFNPRQMSFLDVGALWEHSLAAGGYAKQIMACRKQGREQTTTAFLAGMLHDIGKLILAANFSDVYGRLLQAPPAAPDQRLARERETIGTTHAEIGAYLMGLWGLEPPILAAIAFHHRPLDSQTTAFGPLTAVHTANGFDHRLRASSGDNSDSLDTAYLASLQLTEQVDEWRQACEAMETSAP